jgi:hypothetical protein
MGKRTVLSAREFDLGTGAVLAAFRTAAAGSDASNVRVTRIEVFQNATTTLEMCSLDVSTRDTAGTLTMTSTTPRTISPLGGAASGLAGNTAPAGGDGRSGTNSSADSGGTYTNIFYADFANLNGYVWKPDPNEEIWVPPSTVFIVRLSATPTSALDWGISVWLDENT